MRRGAGSSCRGGPDDPVPPVASTATGAEGIAPGLHRPQGDHAGGVHRVLQQAAVVAHVGAQHGLALGADGTLVLADPDAEPHALGLDRPIEQTDDATFEKPTSTWPHTDAFPRPSVIVSYAK